MKTVHPPTLAELQRWMKWVLTDPRGVQKALSNPKPAAGDILVSETVLKKRYTEPDPSCLTSITDAPPLSPVSRMDIYAEGYFLRLVDYFSEDYARLKAILGVDDFRRLVADYLEEYPSRYANLAEVGRDIVEFLIRHPFTEKHPYLPAVGELEWNVIQSFWAEDCPPFDPTQLATLPPEKCAEAILTLNPSVYLFDTDWPINEIASEAVAKSEGVADIIAKWQPGLYHMMIFREEYTVRILPVERTKFKVLQLLRDGASLGSVCETAHQTIAPEKDLGELSEEFGAWFGEWVGLGIFREITVPT